MLAVAGCGSEEWVAYAYPDRSDLSEHDVVGVFASEDECIDAALEHLSSIRARQSGDVECEAL